MEKIKRIISKIFKRGEPNYKYEYKKNEEPWIPSGEGEKEKIKVTPEELGKVLCGFSHNMTYRYLDDEKTLKGLGIEKIEGDSLYHQDKKNYRLCGRCCLEN